MSEADDLEAEIMEKALRLASLRRADATGKDQPPIWMQTELGNIDRAVGDRLAAATVAVCLPDLYFRAAILEKEYRTAVGRPDRRDDLRQAIGEISFPPQAFVVKADRLTTFVDDDRQSASLDRHDDRGAEPDAARRDPLAPHLRPRSVHR